MIIGQVLVSRILIFAAKNARRIGVPCLAPTVEPARTGTVGLLG